MAEFGFLGVAVLTLVQTPRLRGLLSNAGLLLFFLEFFLRLRINCCIVGITDKNLSIINGLMSQDSYFLNIFGSVVLVSKIQCEI
jgi:hypothetical protein